MSHGERKSHREIKSLMGKIKSLTGKIKRLRGKTKRLMGKIKSITTKQGKQVKNNSY